MRLASVDGGTLPGRHPGMVNGAVLSKSLGSPSHAPRPPTGQSRRYGTRCRPAPTGVSLHGRRSRQVSMGPARSVGARAAPVARPRSPWVNALSLASLRSHPCSRILPFAPQSESLLPGSLLNTVTDSAAWDSSSNQAKDVPRPQEVRPMRRMALIPLFVILLAPTATVAVDDYDRFRLWNQCRPLPLAVGVNEGGAEIGITEETISALVRSRLRSGRLYEPRQGWKEGEAVPAEEFQRRAAYSLRGHTVEVSILGPAFKYRIAFQKHVTDDASKVGSWAETWSAGSFGTHGRGPLSSFLPPWLRRSTSSSTNISG